MRNNQTGFSIVELMVSLSLSLVVVLITTSVYLSNQQAYRFTEAYSLLQENGRFAIHFLRASVQQAGYPRSVANIDAFPADSRSDGGVTGGKPNPDSFTVSYWGQVDCLDKMPAATLPNGNDRLIQETYSIDADGLSCAGNGVGSAAGERLVDGVENMQIEYGVDTDGDGIANTYASTNAVENSAEYGWEDVVSMRIALLVSAGRAVMDQNTSIDIRLLNNPSYTLVDRIPRRVFTTTIPLRNRNKVIF